MAHPVQRKKIKGTDMVLIAGPFEMTYTDKDILGRMIWAFQQSKTAFHVERRHRLLYFWRDAAVYLSGNSAEVQGKRVGSGKNFRPKVWKTKRGEE